jgi:16S rRNA (uracil1498-N3)-methyltransferase
MSNPIFFHENTKAGDVTALEEASAKHAVQVLRMQPGESLELTNGKGLLWTAEITQIGKKQCLVRIEKEETLERLTARKVAIAISPVKNVSRFEWFLEKATELGVAEIFPIKCQRTIKEHFRLDRLRQICLSAMLQSRQAWLPILHEPVAFSDFLVSPFAKAYHHRWIAHCENYEKHNLSKALQTNMPDSLLLIGPEGDFTPEEIFEATNGGCIAVSLGQTRLRTETAGMVGAALMCLG